MTGILVMLIALRDKGEILVPSIQGDDIVTALEKVTGAGLNLKITELAYDAEAPRNAVITQDPEVGSGLKRGRDVRVVISRGAQDIEMPDLCDMSLRQAKNILHSRGLPLPSIKNIHSSVEEGGVVAQLPPAGSRVTDHTRVELLTSMGPLPDMFLLSNFTGHQLKKVTNQIRNAGFKLGRVRYVERDTERSGTVLKQDPKPGNPVVRGQEISLVVARLGSDMGSSSPKTFTVYNFTIPAATTPGKIRVILDNRDGEKDIYSRGHKPGDALSLLVEVAGKTTIRIYLDDDLLEVKHF